MERTNNNVKIVEAKSHKNCDYTLVIPEELENKIRLHVGRYGVGNGQGYYSTPMREPLKEVTLGYCVRICISWI